MMVMIPTTIIPRTIPTGMGQTSWLGLQLPAEKQNASSTQHLPSRFPPPIPPGLTIPVQCHITLLGGVQNDIDIGPWPSGVTIQLIDDLTAL